MGPLSFRPAFWKETAALILANTFISIQAPTLSQCMLTLEALPVLQIMAKYLTLVISLQK